MAHETYFFVFREIVDEAVQARKRIVCTKMTECLRVIENACAQINKVRGFFFSFLFIFHFTYFFKFAWNCFSKLVIVLIETYLIMN